MGMDILLIMVPSMLCYDTFKCGYLIFCFDSDRTKFKLKDIMFSNWEDFYESTAHNL